MSRFKIEIMIVGIRVKRISSLQKLWLSLSFLFLLLLIVQEFIIVDNLHTGIRVGGNFYQVELLLLRDF
jgi:hypothetical protein